MPQTSVGGSSVSRAHGFATGLLLGALPAALAMVLGVFAGGAAWVRDGGAAERLSPAESR